MDNITELTVVVPVYNEQESLAWFLPDLVNFCRQRGYALITVDDASTDNSHSMLKDYAMEWDGMTILRHKVNRGYGAAVMTGLSAAKTPLAITIDADGQHRLSDIERFVEKQRQTDADLIIGKRPLESGAAAQIYRSIGKQIIRMTARMLVDLKITDLNSGMKLYNTELAQKYLALCPSGMAFSDVITLIFVQQKDLVIEIPITVEERKSGVSTINAMTALDTLIQIFNIVMVFNPLRIFLPAGGIAIVTGLLWALPFFLRGNGLSATSMLLILSGFILLMLGLIAEQLSQIRKDNLK